MGHHRTHFVKNMDKNSAKGQGPNSTKVVVFMNNR